jgi:hypothetical protein
MATRKVITITAAVAATTFLIFGDDAPVVPAPGGTVKPIQEDDVRMKNEVVVLTLERDGYLVEVNYEFVNSGDAKTVMMGFPNFAEGAYVDEIDDFKMWARGERLEVTRRYAEERVSEEEEWKGRKCYECSNVSFGAGETVRVRNAYSQRYERDFEDSWRKARYVLTTGALWKDDIESVRVEVVPAAHSTKFLSRVAVFPEYEDTIIYGGLTISPGDFVRAGNRRVFEWRNVEPDFDLEITFPPPLTTFASATSTLEAKGYDYDPNLATDGDPTTAWVEGAKDEGVGEALRVECADYKANGNIKGEPILRAVGIVNGYAKNDAIWRANCRVKRARVTLASDDGATETSFTTTLADKPEEQIVEFPEPARVGVVEIEILDVYPGEKYDDCAVSEMYFYPEQP